MGKETLKKEFKNLCEKDRGGNHQKRHQAIEDVSMVKITQYPIQNIQEQNYEKAKTHLNIILEAIKELEKIDEKLYEIHKGTPYYFLAITHILSGSLEEGFQRMHMAYEEDKKTTKKIGGNYKKLPAYNFVSLKEEEQYAGIILKEAKKFLTSNTSIENFDIDIFQINFLQTEKYQEIVFFFVFQLFRAKTIHEIQTETNSEFDTLLKVDILFNFCLIIENILQKQYPKLTGGLKINHKERKKIKTKFSQNEKIEITKNDFDNIFIEGKATLKNYLDKLPIKPKQIGKIQAEESIENDLSNVLFLRNYGGHNIESNQDIGSQFDRCLKSVFNTIYYIIKNIPTEGLSKNN